MRSNYTRLKVSISALLFCAMVLCNSSCKDSFPPGPHAEIAPTRADTLAQLGLVAAYDFDNETLDITKNGHDGSSVHSAFGENRFHEPLTALRAGTANGVAVQNTIGLTFRRYHGFTISFWFLGDPNIHSGGGLLSLWPTGSSLNGYSFEEHEGRIEVSITDQNARRPLLSTRVNVMDSEWHQLTFVVLPNNSARLILDGVIRDGAPLYSDSADSTTVLPPLFIGTDADHMHAFSGMLDDLLIYNRAIEPKEIDSIVHFRNWQPKPPPIDTQNLIENGGFGFKGPPVQRRLDDQNCQPWQPLSNGAPYIVPSSDSIDNVPGYLELRAGSRDKGEGASQVLQKPLLQGHHYRLTGYVGGSQYSYNGGQAYTHVLFFLSSQNSQNLPDSIAFASAHIYDFVSFQSDFTAAHDADLFGFIALDDRDHPNPSKPVFVRVDHLYLRETP